MKKNFVFLDAGHGGVNRQGVYTTEGKQAYHELADFGHSSITPDVFLEGVWNRIVTGFLAQELRKYNVVVVPVYHEYKDKSLTYRWSTANKVYKQALKDNSILNSAFVSCHANAFNGKARGFEVYTSPNQTDSDLLADKMFWHAKARLLPKYKDRGFAMRPNTRNSNYNKEARFSVLVNTIMPAVLLEPDFFDNREGAMLLNDYEFIRDYVQILTDSLLECFSYNILTP